MQGLSVSIGGFELYVCRHWDLALWRRRFFWLDLRRSPGGVVAIVAGVEIAVHRKGSAA